MAATGTLAENLEKVANYRAEIAERGVKNIINGRHADALSGETYENGTPIDSSLICTVAKGNAADIDRAAQAAQDAFPAWATLPAKKRRDLLYRVAELIEANAEKIALLESLDTGQPIRFMSAAAVRSAENFPSTFPRSKVRSRSAPSPLCPFISMANAPTWNHC
jgi:5-carboxymethyl-2-hydroxymuconic-semialdehyde dehydrogenase